MPYYVTIGSQYVITARYSSDPTIFGLSGSFNVTASSLGACSGIRCRRACLCVCARLVILFVDIVFQRFINYFCSFSITQF